MNRCRIYLAGVGGQGTLFATMLLAEATLYAGVNAVVVLHDPYKENNPNSKTMVILTNRHINKPLKVYDAYDIRREIENSLF